MFICHFLFKSVFVLLSYALIYKYVTYKIHNAFLFMDKSNIISKTMQLTLSTNSLKYFSLE